MKEKHEYFRIYHNGSGHRCIFECANMLFETIPVCLCPQFNGLGSRPRKFVKELRFAIDSLTANCGMELANGIIE